MELGGKVYYDTRTGAVLVVTGDSFGDVRETTEDEDFAAFTPLKNRERDTVDVLRFEYGQYSEDYAAGGYIAQVNVETKEPLFVYPEAGEGPVKTPEPALSDRVKAAESEVERLTAADLDNKEMIATLYELTMGGAV